MSLKSSNHSGDHHGTDSVAPVAEREEDNEGAPGVWASKLKSIISVFQDLF